MKNIPTLEINEDLAHIKQMEQSILTEKLTSVIKVIIAIIVLSISCYSIWGFIVDSILTLPPDTSAFDMTMHVLMCIIRNLLISACICLIFTTIFKIIKFIRTKLRN